MNVAIIDESSDISDEEIQFLIDRLIEHNEAVINSSIDVVGGLEKAIIILNNAPKDANVYDIMYKQYAYLDDSFMLDHNLTVKLSDLEKAIFKHKV